MKELGIYDDALIVLMADHGGHIPPDRYRPPDPAEASHGFVMNPWVVAMASPLLLIKLPGASGPLRTSPAQTSALDTAATIAAILGLKERFPGTDALGIEADAMRERRFYQYTWRRADYVTDYILPVQELLIRGSLYENDSWSFGREFAPPAGAE
jgi:arylsulfatase A-like enzyme